MFSINFFCCLWIRACEFNNNYKSIPVIMCSIVRIYDTKRLVTMRLHREVEHAHSRLLVYWASRREVLKVVEWSPTERQTATGWSGHCRLADNVQTAVHNWCMVMLTRIQTASSAMTASAAQHFCDVAVYTHIQYTGRVVSGYREIGMLPRKQVTIVTL